MRRPTTAFVLALLLCLALPLAGASAQGFNPVCGLKGGEGCDEPAAKPKPKRKKAKPKPKRRAKRQAPRGKSRSKGIAMRFAVEFGGPPTEGNRSLGSGYSLTLGKGSGGFRVIPAARRGRRPRILAVHGTIRIAHQYPGFAREMTVRVYRGTSYFTTKRNPYDSFPEPQGVGIGLQMRVIRSNDPSCPVGRKGAILMYQGVPRRAASYVGTYLCGGDYTWRHNPSAYRIAVPSLRRVR